MPKTIDDIIPPSRRRMMESESMRNEPNYQPPTPPQPPITNSTPLPPMPPVPPARVKIRVGKSFPYGTALIVLVIIAVCAGALYAFAGAQVTIIPASQTSAVSGDFTATNGSGNLPYIVVSLNKTASTVVPAESTLTANDSAQGTITISNAQPTAQTLITNTRFQTPDGLIFRIHTPVTIPPATSSGPGTISAPVYADQPGANYNVGPTTFTVPGLQGSTSYTLVTASSASAMTGGFAGTRPAVSQATDDSHHSALQSTIASGLQTALLSKIPSGYVVVPGGSQTTYQALSDTASSTSVAITEEGTINAVAFPEAALAQAVAYKVAGTYSGEPISLASVSSLNLTPDATSTNFSSLSSASSFSFTLSGTATLIWQVDASKIAGAVAGKTRDSAQSILAGFPEIQRATLILRPFWSDTFPQDPSHIHVVVSAPAASQ
jgi:hypothetical protein